MKRNKLLALFLALALCLSPSALAARGETKVVVKGCFQITMDGFLRTETYRFPEWHYTDEGIVLQYDEFTFYVVRDNATVTVEPAPGYQYATDRYVPMEKSEGPVAYYGPSGRVWLETNQQFSGWGVGHLEYLTEPDIFTVTPSKSDIYFPGSCYGIKLICESDFARMPQYPDRGDPKADAWAGYDIVRSFDLGLFPVGLDPYEDDCTREMTRGEFATALYKLYQKLGGSVSNLSRNTPFTDLPGGDARGYIALAYKLGLVEGTSPTTFSPDDPLTREQAAAMVSRLCETFSDELEFDDDYWLYYSYDDKDQISPWARSAVILMSNWDIMTGTGVYGYQTFSPQKALTVQEGMAVIQRTLDHICFDRYYKFD